MLTDIGVSEKGICAGFGFVELTLLPGLMGSPIPCL
jgi:hypothetical protein